MGKDGASLCYILYTPVVEKMTLIGYKAYNYDLVVG
jgi:hypothetical protein